MPDSSEDNTESDQLRARDEKVLTDLMNTPQGRDWVSRLLDYCQMGVEVYHNDGDVYAALKRDGLAQAGRYIEKQILDTCMDRYMQMIRERRGKVARQRKRAEDEERAASAVAPVGAVTLEDMMDRQREEGEAIAAREARATAEQDKRE